MYHGPRHYFNYHATAHKLIFEGKLKHYYFCENYHGISPALVLCFNDEFHPVMPIREERWDEYERILPAENEIAPPNT